MEPLLNQYKPPGLIKEIYFTKFTMGDQPFRQEQPGAQQGHAAACTRGLGCRRAHVRASCMAAYVEGWQPPWAQSGKQPSGQRADRGVEHSFPSLAGAERARVGKGRGSVYCPAQPGADLICALT